MRASHHPPKALIHINRNSYAYSGSIFYNVRMAGTEISRSLRKRSTWVEKLVWCWLRDRRFTGYKIRRQHPVGPYHLDFFCEEARLAIELDGSRHGFPAEQKHDQERDAFLSSRGIKILRFWNSHLRRNHQSMQDTIFQEFQARAPHPLPEYTRPLAESKSQ